MCVYVSLPPSLSHVYRSARHIGVSCHISVCEREKERESLSMSHLSEFIVSPLVEMYTCSNTALGRKRKK